jgi:hypothetical protein
MPMGSFDDLYLWVIVMRALTTGVRSSLKVQINDSND